LGAAKDEVLNLRIKLKRKVKLKSKEQRMKQVKEESSDISLVVVDSQKDQSSVIEKKPQNIGQKNQ